MTAIVLAAEAGAARVQGSPDASAIQFRDLGRLRVQECERVMALKTELTKCGARVVEQGDTLFITPTGLHGAEIDTYSDHRMACVKKTFPNFFQKLSAPAPQGLGAEIWEVRAGKRLRKLRGADLFAD